MVEIYPNLFIGSQVDYEGDVKFKKGWAVVHACKEPYHRDLLGYKTRGAPKDHPEYLVAPRGDRLFLNLVDADDPAYIPKEIMDTALMFIHDALNRKLKVLVHCNLGESRAPAIGFLYLLTFTGGLSGEALEDIELEFRSKYSSYRPSRGISGFLRKYWRTYSEDLH